MLSKADEARLSAWIDRQIPKIKEKNGVDIDKSKLTIDLNKSIEENCNDIGVQIKTMVLGTQNILVQDNTKKQQKIKSPFEKVTTKEYKNIMSQLPDSVSLNVTDIGKDATEEIVIAYLHNNYGLTIKTLEESKVSPKEVNKAQQEQAKAEYMKQIEQQRAEAEEKLMLKAQAIMKDGGCPLLSKAEQIYAYFTKQNMGCEHLTLLSQFGLFGLSTKFMFEGSGGIGKSRSSTEQIERWKPKFDDNRIRVLSGHFSPLQFYEILYNHKDKKDLLVIDEGFFITNDDNIKQMLRDALFRGQVYWQSKSKLAEHLPGDFKYDGSMIINTNQFGKREDPSTGAFLDRLIVFKLVMSNDEIIQKINNSRTFQIDEALEQEMINRVMAVRGGLIKEELNEEDKDYIYQFVVNEIRFLSTIYSKISFRTIQKCELLYKCFKSYFGGFNEFTKNWYEQLSKLVIKGNTTENFIIATIKRGNGRIKTSELKDMIMEHYGVGRTQAYDRIAQLKESGLIEGTKEIILTRKVEQ